MNAGRLAITCVFLLLMAAGASALEAPAHDGYVTDRADMISAATEQTLERTLAELDRTDSTQIAVLTIPSLEGENLEQFSMRVAETWKVGQKGTDNGVILLVSKNDRKIRIEVGYGLEGVLTDVMAGSIIDNVITPYFKTNDYNGGFTQGVNEIIKGVQGEFTPSARKKDKLFPIVGLLIIILLPFLGVLTSPIVIKLVRGDKIDFNTAIRWGYRVGTDQVKFGGSNFGGGFGGGGFGGGGASGGW